MQRQLVGEPPPDRDTLPRIETFQRALFDILGDRGEIGEIVGADAAHEHTGGAERR